MIDGSVSTDGKLQIVFGDTDTLSSFLNRGCLRIFTDVFADMGVEVIVPKLVYDELAYGGGRDGLRITPILQLERANKLKIVDIELLSDEIENRPCNTMCCQGFTNFRKYFYISTIISL